MEQIINVEQKSSLCGYGYCGGVEVIGIINEEDADLNWINARTSARLKRRREEAQRAQVLLREKKAEQNRRKRAVLRFFAWQGVGALMSALLLGVAALAGLTSSWLVAVIPAALAMYVQQEVGRATL